MGHQIAGGLCETGQNGKCLQLTAMIVWLSVIHPIGPGRLSLSQVERENISLKNVWYTFSYLFWIHEWWEEDNLSLAETCQVSYSVGHRRSKNHHPSTRKNENPKAWGHCLVAQLCHFLILALVKILSSCCQRATCQYQRLLSKRYQSDVETMCSQGIDNIASWLEQCDITPMACQRNIPKCFLTASVSSSWTFHVHVSDFEDGVEIPIQE